MYETLTFFQVIIQQTLNNKSYR